MREEKIDFDTCSIRVKVFHPERTEKQISAKRIQGFELTLFLFLLDILSHLPLPSFHWPSWDLHWHIFVDLLDTLNSSPHIFKKIHKESKPFFSKFIHKLFFLHLFYYFLYAGYSILHPPFSIQNWIHGSFRIFISYFEITHSTKKGSLFLAWLLSLLLSSAFSTTIIPSSFPWAFLWKKCSFYIWFEIDCWFISYSYVCNFRISILSRSIFQIIQ